MLLLKPIQPDQDPALTNQIRKESHVTVFGHFSPFYRFGVSHCIGLGLGNYDLYGNKVIVISVSF